MLKEFLNGMENDLMIQAFNKFGNRGNRVMKGLKFYFKATVMDNIFLSSTQK